jgi:EAL domain-containing protein (putative c-di-GMP-specific phosphodiesterase class I)
MSPEKLTLEITETAFMHDTGTSFKIIEALHSLGIN